MRPRRAAPRPTFLAAPSRKAQSRLCFSAIGKWEEGFGEGANLGALCRTYVGGSEIPMGMGETDRLSRLGSLSLAVSLSHLQILRLPEHHVLTSATTLGSFFSLPKE